MNQGVGGGVPIERIVLLGLVTVAVAALVTYVIYSLTREAHRLFNLWVIQRARYLEQSHHQASHKPGPKNKGTARKRRGKSPEDSYSGSDDDDSNSRSE